MRRALSLIPTLWLFGCPPPGASSDAGPDTGSCVPDRATWDTLQPEIARHCGGCHGTSPQFGAPFPLATYEDVVGARRHLRVATAVASGAMPPSPLPRMPVEVARAVTEWASCGTQTVTAQRGITSSAAPWMAPLTGPSGETLELLAREFPVGVDDTDRYRCFVFDVPVASERFIRRFDMVFDETSVLHHLVLLRDPERNAPNDDFDCIGSMPAGTEYLYAWAPGQGAVEFPEGGLRVRPGERYVMQLHYNNSAGRVGVRDSSGVRLTLGPTEGTEYGMIAIGPLAFELAPRMTTRRSSQCTVTTASRMLAGMPHMHEHGVAFHEHIERTGGTREPVVDLTGWDFHTQLFYSLPVELRPGDRIFTECTWTNATSERVQSGPRTEDEMCFNFAYVTPPPAARYCDEAAGSPTDVTYTPGACGSGFSTTPALQRLAWVEETPTPLTGGTVVDGDYAITGGRMLIDHASLPVGTLDLTRSFQLVRGQARFSGASVTFVSSAQSFLQTVDGPSFASPQSRSVTGTWSPGTSPATLTASCPSGTEPSSFEYEVRGRDVVVRFGPASPIPGARLWVEYVLAPAT